MNKMGMQPDKFFAKVINAGSHENAVMAVQQGTCDVAFNWWNSEDDFEPDAHGQQGHGEEGRFQDRLQVREDPRLALRRARFACRLT